MYAATCAECGKATEVPFRPNGQKPVFCRDCFASKRGTEDRGDSRDTRRDDRREERPRSFEKREYTPAAPAQRSASQAEDKRIDELSRKVELIHKKLDTVMEMIEGMALAKGNEIQQVELAKTVKKVAAKKQQKEKTILKSVASAVGKKTAAKKK
jgi:CxxC-x17-CxxC domain-containing protein